MNKNKRKTYYCCIVPMCTSTTTKTPNKEFIFVPRDKRKRILWLNACRRNPNDLSTKSRNHVLCEDHFNLENDMENYIKWKLVGGPKKMKKDVIPHKFDCQLDRKQKFIPVSRSLATKRQKQRLVDEAIQSTLSTSIMNEEKTSIEDICANSVEEIPVIEEGKRHFGVQVTPRYKSKKIQCHITKPKNCASYPPIKQNTAVAATSPIETRRVLSRSSSSLSANTISFLDNTLSSQTIPSPKSSEISTDDDLDNYYLKKEIKKNRLDNILNIINLNTRRYLGIPEECIFIMNYLYEQTMLNTISIYLTLKKIRISQPFSELADDFGISKSAASRIFYKTVILISRVLKDIIIWPSKETIIDTLPTQFKARYTNVQSIIDCLEIEIQKPFDSTKQSLTWSQFKKCNTLKFLISSTPDGIINFISTGYGGRTSDAFVVEECGFLEKLQPGNVVMADRGFKYIENLLIQNKCTLLRPPSVASGQKLSKKDTLKTKQIASLRIHIERVIRKVREFKILNPHSCVDLKTIPYMDYIIIIVCGLINLQALIIP